LPVLLLLLTSSFTGLDGTNTKFGHVSMDELKMTVYEKDPEAEAVVLYDYGYSYLKYEDEAFRLYFNRHKRVKILKKAGYEYATDKIMVYHNSEQYERVTDLKGFTYNLENGRLVKTKLDEKAIFNEKVSDKWNAWKFTMPAVKEGSVIEYSYTIKSDFVENMRDWEFQSAIPTVWSECKAKIYNFFNYQQIFHGYEPLFINNHEISRESIFVRQAARDGYGMASAGSAGNSFTIGTTASNYRFVLKDIQALREEPFITTMEDYTAKIFFDLSTVQFPESPVKRYSETWESVDSTLLNLEMFGKQLAKTDFLDKELASLSLTSLSSEKKMLAIHDFVKHSMKWNEEERLVCVSILKKAWEAKTGSSADINLLLVSMLRKAGIAASPVVLSTRSNGKLMKNFALISKLNYVVVLVIVEGKEYLLDATDPINGPNMLPFRCLNREGRVINETGSRWIPLNSPNKQSQMLKAQLTVDAEGYLVGSVKAMAGGYTALDMKREILVDGENNYVNSMKKKNHSWEIDTMKIGNLHDSSNSLDITYKVRSAEPATVGNLIYLNPMFFDRETDNPFKIENRRFPVDFGVLREKAYTCSFTIPEGYLVEELPKAAIIELPEKTGRFTYNLITNGNNIHVSSVLQLKKTLYTAEEYAALRQFYSLVVAKHAEQIVLKKL
jgi:hypothetical protein